MAPDTPESGLRATVLGGGQWGTALAHLLASHGHATRLWLRSADIAAAINERHENARYLDGHAIHPGVEATTDLAAAATFAETLIVAIPSNQLRGVARELGDHVTCDQILLSATKGLTTDTLTRMSEILREETCAKKVGALSGPNLAREVMAGQPSATVVASRFEEVIEKAERLLAGPTFRLYGNRDIVGVELAGALKNVVAIASGVCAGLGFGANSLALLMTRGLAEMARFGAALGAIPDTFQGLAGVGDLICTCTSTLSRNHTVGRRLAEGKTLAEIEAEMYMVAEGVNTTLAVHNHARRLGVDMPIAAGMHAAIYEGAALDDVLGSLMARFSRYEEGDEPIHARRSVPGSIVDAYPAPRGEVS